MAFFNAKRNRVFGKNDIYDPQSQLLDMAQRSQLQVAQPQGERTRCKCGRKFLVASFVLLLLVIIATALLWVYLGKESSDGKPTIPTWSQLRLPIDVQPTEYKLSLNVDMYSRSYSGEVVVDVVIRKETSRIVINTMELNLASTAVKEAQTMREIPIRRTLFQPRFEQFVIVLQQNLKLGRHYLLEVAFNRQMRTDLQGFYWAGEDVAATFFSPISARRAFPCFDEPNMKANFSLSITHHVAFKALANMAPRDVHLGNDNKSMTTHFQTSIRMSTYILCWVVANLSSRAFSSSMPAITAWAKQAELPYTSYGIVATEKLLRYYEEYFGIPFPLTKLDLVSLPAFGPSAMENWGLITFRANKFLAQANSTLAHRQEVLGTVAHELVHQWFGNLATMDYWEEAWLKEGFASFISYQGGDFIDPSMRFMDKILPEMALPALSLDAYSSSHPISTSANTPDEIREIFDKITYNKGSCVVQILQGYLGDADFRKGLNVYLTRYAYGNAAQDDLWEQLRLASGKNVKAVMDTWTLQLGYPVVHVQRLNQTTVKLRQQRFSLDPPGVEPPKSPFNYLWKIPVTYRSLVSGETGLHLFSDPEGTFHVPSNSIINVDHAMFYRVSYDEQELAMITASLGRNRSLFSSSDRVGLISDAFNLVAANLLSLEKALDLTKYYAGDANYYPWQTMLDELTQIPVFAESTETGVLLRHYVSNLIVNVSSALGWIKHSSSNEDLLQARLLRVGCEVNNSNISSEGLQLFRSWMNGTLAEVSAGALEAIQYCGIRFGTSKEWELVWEKQKTSGALEQFQLQRLLAATRNASLTNRLLESSLDFNVVNRQNSPYLIAVIARSSDVARGAAWALVKRRWNDIFDQYGSQLFLLGRMLTGVLSGFSTEADLRDVETFFSVTKELGTGKQAVKESIQKIKANIAWRERHEKSLSMWLKKQQA